jgi:hypothetical protein
VLRSFLRVVDATALCAVHVALASWIFLASAFYLAQADQDAASRGQVVRGLAAIWMWWALRQYVWRGILRRSGAPAPGQKPASGGRAAIGRAGCLGAVAAIAAIYLLAGQWADWAYAGLTGEDMAHPARRALDRAVAWFDALLADPQAIRMVALRIGGVIVAYATLSVLAREPRSGPEAAAARAREAGARVPRRESPSAAASKLRLKPSATSMDDPVLGRLRWDARAGGWRPADRREGRPALIVRTDGSPPTDAQLDLAHRLVQRSFEVLLRGSEAARVAATADGVGLPRFALAEATVEPDTSGRPGVTLRLRCEGEPGRIYTVRSVNGMDSFTVG